MRRREFLGVLVAVAVWPHLARGQQTDRVWRVGALNALAETDLSAQAWDAAFRKRLDELGLIDGRNIHIDYRWAAGSIDRIKLFAKELIRLDPDVLVAVTTPATAALQTETRTIPIIFANVSDPVGSGFVSSLARPGGNITGFIDVEASLSGKWLELMHEIAPQVSRVGILFNPQTAPYARYYLDPFRSAASALSMVPFEAPVQSGADVEAAMTKLGRQGGAGLIVMPDTSAGTYRETIISAADHYRLPAIYFDRSFVASGGLISYGVDFADTLRGAATYLDRILRGVKVSELPVQLPTKFELFINLKTARALGLTIPDRLLAVADEVFE
jgi:putative tryptophan/tyrosine transport system substrate-binding protein